MRIALSSVDVPFLRVQASFVCQMPTSGRDNIIGKLKREPVANVTSEADKSGTAGIELLSAVECMNYPQTGCMIVFSALLDVLRAKNQRKPCHAVTRHGQQRIAFAHPSYRKEI
jgi:hypothetical protein